MSKIGMEGTVMRVNDWEERERREVAEARYETQELAAVRFHEMDEWDVRDKDLKENRRSTCE
jgi:hypothetical protein